MTLIVSCGIVSCSKDDNGPEVRTGQVSFGSYSSSAKPNAKVAMSTPAKARVTIENEVGQTMLEDGVEIDLYTLGDGFVSENLTLSPGDYELTLFHLLDENGDIIYAAPIEGSPKANSVVDALPISFEVTPDNITKLSPEVLVIEEEDDPADFGYINFEFDIVSTFEFDFAVLSDWDSSLVASQVVVVERDLDYQELRRYETNYGAKGFETLHLRLDVPVHEIQVVSSDYYSLSYVSFTDRMIAPEQSLPWNTMFKPSSNKGNLLFLSRKDVTVKYFVPLFPYNYQSYLFVYVPKNPDIHFLRIDFAGWHLNGVDMAVTHNAIENPEPLGAGTSYGISGSPAGWGWKPMVDPTVNPFFDQEPTGNYLMTGFHQDAIALSDQLTSPYFRIENQIAFDNFFNGEEIVDLRLELQWNSNEGLFTTYCNECGSIFYEWGDGAKSHTENPLSRQ